MAELTFDTAGNNVRLYWDGGLSEPWSVPYDHSTGGVQSGGIFSAYKDAGADGAYGISRVGLGFNTSSIPDTATITAAKIQLYPTSIIGNADTTSANVVSFAPADPSNMVSADYTRTKWGTAKWGSITLATLAANLNVYNDITLDANGIANISKTGITTFGIRIARDTDNSAPTGTNAFNATAASTQLVVTYSLPSSGFFALL